MLCLTRQQGNCQAVEMIWLVGKERPVNCDTQNLWTDIIAAEASGEELIYIRARFNNLPDVPNSDIIRWTGADAQFIYDHLCDMYPVGCLDHSGGQRTIL